MPTHEAIVNTAIPKEVEKPIPVRVITTRVPKAKVPTENGDQPTTSGSDVSAAAESAAPAESVKLSPQLSAFARKEQAFRQREQALKEREKTLESKLADAEKFSQLKTKIGTKDFSEIEALGLNYDEYSQYLVNKLNGEDPQTQAYKKLESEIQELKKNTEEKATREYEETVSEYRKEITALVASDPNFSSVKELKREDAVLQLILDSWEEDGTEISIQQAATDIEEYLVAEAEKMASLTKVKSKFGELAAKRLPPPKPGLKTLTQQVVVGSEKRPQKSLQHLSESERYAEARRRVLERRSQQG